MLPHAHTADLQDDMSENLDGFGVVTLASLLPIMAVQLLSIAIVETIPEKTVDAYIEERLLSKGALYNSTDGTAGNGIGQDAIFAVRAILPLASALVLMIVLLVGKELPPLSFTAHTESSTDNVTAAAAASGAAAVVLEALAERLADSDSDSSVDDEETSSAHGEAFMMEALGDRLVMDTLSEEGDGPTLVMDQNVEKSSPSPERKLLALQIGERPDHLLEANAKGTPLDVQQASDVSSTSTATAPSQGYLWCILLLAVLETLVSECCLAAVCNRGKKWWVSRG